MLLNPISIARRLNVLETAPPNVGAVSGNALKMTGSVSGKLQLRDLKRANITQSVNGKLQGLLLMRRRLVADLALLVSGAGFGSWR